MAFDWSTQFRTKSSCRWHEHGEIAFTTTGTTVEVTTKLTKVYAAIITPKATMGGIGEVFFCDRTVTSGAVTITRECLPIYLGAVAGADYLTSYNYVEVPIGVAELAGTLQAAWYYNDVKNGGTPLINIGKVPTNGTGTADPDYFLADAKAEAAPANSVGKKITDFTLATVTAGDLITFSTTGGTTSDPEGGFCQVKYTPTPTSALTVNYLFLGY